MKSERTEESYVIDALARAMKVYEALEGRAFEPISIQRVAQRTGFSHNFCRRALITFKKSGWAKQTIEGWSLGPKAMNLASRYGAALLHDSTRAVTAPNGLGAAESRGSAAAFDPVQFVNPRTEGHSNQSG
jgi:hypothetical protein